MNSGNKVVLRMEGPAQNNYHLELSVFKEKLEQFRKLLTASVKESKGDEKGVTYYIIALSHSSPTTLECVPKDGGREATANTIKNILNKFQSVENEKAADISDPVLSSMESLAKPDKKKLEWVEIQAIIENTPHIYRLDESFRKKLEAARRSETEVFSTVDGKLEQVNIHNQANRFTIYTFSSSVSCEFDDSMMEEVQNALGRNVSVSGKCFYRSHGALPYRIKAEKMKILPKSEDLPSFKDIFGIAPEATGDKTTQQFIRELRDQWD